jgi:hypothetical protein
LKSRYDIIHTTFVMDASAPSASARRSGQHHYR